MFYIFILDFWMPLLKSDPSGGPSGLTGDDPRGSLRGPLALLHTVAVHLLLNLLKFLHGIQAVPPPLLLHSFADVGF